MRYQAGGQDALLIWAQTIASQNGVAVSNWTSSWKSGLALCSIVEYYHEGGINFAQLDPQQSEKNLELAISVAEGDGIPRLLDPEDFLIRVPDRRSVITYLSSMYQIYRLKLSKIQSFFGGPVSAKGPLSPLPPMKSVASPSRGQKNTRPVEAKPIPMLSRQNSGSPSRSPLQRRNVNTPPQTRRASPKVARVVRAPSPKSSPKRTVKPAVIPAPSKPYQHSVLSREQPKRHESPKKTVTVPTRPVLKATPVTPSKPVTPAPTPVNTPIAVRTVQQDAAPSPRFSSNPFIVAEKSKKESLSSQNSSTPKQSSSASYLAESLSREEARMQRQMDRIIASRRPPPFSLASPSPSPVAKPKPTPSAPVSAPVSVSLKEVKPQKSAPLAAETKTGPANSPIRGVRNNPFLLAEKRSRETRPQVSEPPAKAPVKVVAAPKPAPEPVKEQPKPSVVRSVVRASPTKKKSLSPKESAMSRQERRMQSMINRQCQLYATRTIQKKPDTSPVQKQTAARTQRQLERDRIRAELRYHQKETRQLQESRETSRKVSRDILERANALLTSKEA